VTLRRALQDVSGAAEALRMLGLAHLFRGESNEAERLFSESLESYRSVGDQRGEAWALQNLAWIAFNNADPATSEQRLQQSAELFGELGDWGGLGWAFGMLAYVRYMQGRLDEAAELAEQIAVEGLETGNRWAVGMMDVLLANVALWRGRATEAVREGRAAVKMFHDIGDAWGETQAHGPVVRALAERGRFDELRTARARRYEVARTQPDQDMPVIPNVVEACALLQFGHAGDVEAVLEPTLDRGYDGLGSEDEGIGFADWIATRGLMLLQLGRVDEAVQLLERPYALADNDGSAMNLGSRLALTYAMHHRADDALRVIEELQDRTGGTYSDRLTALWAESLARLQSGRGDARAAVDAAHAIATATDAPVEHAIAALARAHVFEALGEADAAAVREDAERQLDAVGITGAGWKTIFDRALARV
jgi:tetratricopeptide (TPR) repeat protein